MSNPPFEQNFLMEKTCCSLWRRPPVNEFGITEVALIMEHFRSPYLQVNCNDGMSYGTSCVSIDLASGLVTIPEDSKKMLFVAKEWLDREKIKELCKRAQNEIWRRSAKVTAIHILKKKYYSEYQELVKEEFLKRAAE